MPGFFKSKQNKRSIINENQHNSQANQDSKNPLDELLSTNLDVIQKKQAIVLMSSFEQ